VHAASRSVFECAWLVEPVDQESNGSSNMPSEWERKAYGDIGAHELEQHRARQQDLKEMKARHDRI